MKIWTALAALALLGSVSAVRRSAWDVDVLSSPPSARSAALPSLTEAVDAFNRGAGLARALAGRRTETPLDPEELDRLSPREWEDMLGGAAWIERKLDTTRIDLDFDKTIYEDVLEIIRDVSGLDLILDANPDPVLIDQRVTIRLRGVTLREAILSVVQQVDAFGRLRVLPEEGIVLITSDPPGSAVTQPLPVDLAGGNVNTAPYLRDDGGVLSAVIVSLDARNAPISAMLRELEEKTGFEIRLVETPDRARYTFKAEHMTLEALLERLLLTRGYGFVLRDGTIWVARRTDGEKG